MNILFYRYGSICEPDIIKGFQELGNHISEITLEVTDKNTSPLEGIAALKNELLAHSYDFVFSVNFYPFIAEVCNIFQLRYLCWTVDSPVLELYSNSICHPWNRIFLFDRMQYEEFSPYNPSCIFHLPLATNPARWSGVIQQASASQLSKWKSDISFVGSLYTEKCPYDHLLHLPAYEKGYLEGIMNAQMKIYGCYFLEDLLSDSLIDTFRSCMPDFYIPPELSRRNDRATTAQLYLCSKISSMERLHTMKLIGAKYHVNLYTGSDTANLPVRNCGRVKTLTEMPLVFASSKINLNITAKAIRSGVPLRVFDILGCGGFLLTNYQAELADYFTIGSDLDCYTDDDDLLSKIDYYLCHENDRLEIAHNGLETVKKLHNYPERILQMLSLAFGVS